MKWAKGNFSYGFIEKGGAEAMVNDRPLEQIAKIHGLTVEEIKAQIAERAASVAVYVSDTGYQVIVAEAFPFVSGWPDMIHLSIRNEDRSALIDWRDLQEIKNDLVGKENEGVQLFPADSRLVDQANQFHLWVLKDPEERFPFGYAQRCVVGRRAAEAVGAKQRPLPKRKKGETGE